MNKKECSNGVVECWSGQWINGLLDCWIDVSASPEHWVFGTRCRLKPGLHTSGPI